MPILSSRLIRLTLAFVVCLLSAFADESKRSFDVPAGPAEKALKVFAEQSGRGLLVTSETAKGVVTQAVKGAYTAQEALDRMLADTGLVASQDPKNGAFVVKRENGSGPNAERAAQMESDRPGQKLTVEDGVVKMGEFEVFGSKLVNADLPRTRDDIQPYVVIGREQIEAANALNLEDYFRTRLPMNNAPSFIQGGQLTPLNYSSITLRGLSSGQTLILIDGRRAPPRGSGGNILQADINGIPMSMIERIEILPSTASGIYGGGATGGVINIITRKDYAGVEATLSYTNTFDTDTGIKRADLNGSWSLEEGKTFLSLSSSYSTSNQMIAGDRDFINRSRALQLKNNPAAFYSLTTPPSGYTSNIRSQNGSDLVLKSQYGGTSLGSPITFVPVGFQGVAISGAAPLVANAGKYNLDFSEAPGNGGKLNAQGVALKVQSLALAARRKFGRKVEVYAEYSAQDSYGYNRLTGLLNTFTTLPATAPNNPFTVPIVVSWPPTGLRDVISSFSETQRALAGIAIKLPREWTAGVDFSWGESVSGFLQPTSLVGDPDGAGPLPSFNTALTNGTLDILRDLNAYPLDYGPYRMPKSGSENRGTLVAQEWVGRASGPLWDLPAGALLISGSLNWRDESLKNQVREITSSVPSTYSFTPGVSSESKSAYLELKVPLLSDRRPSLLRALELQASVRYDEYRLRALKTAAAITIPSPEGPFPFVDYQTQRMDSTSETVGLKFSPTKDLALRASWGTGFLPPALGQLVVSPFSTSVAVTDPKRGNVLASIGPVINESQGNPDLRPEDSQSTSAGIILTPRFLPGFRLSVDYTRITKTNEIAFLSIQQLFDFEDTLPGRIVRDPLTAQEQALGYTGGKVTILRTGPVNVARKKLTAYDIQADYQWQSEHWGKFRAYALATYQPQLATQPVANAQYIETIGFTNGLKWRGNAGLDWQKGHWSSSWAMQYYDSYLGYSPLFTASQTATFILNQGSARIPSQIYHDVSVAYNFGVHANGWKRLLRNTRVTAGVQNVFNTSPPILASTTPQAGYSPYGDPRLARYNVSVRKQF